MEYHQVHLLITTAEWGHNSGKEMHFETAKQPLVLSLILELAVCVNERVRVRERERERDAYTQSAGSELVSLTEIRRQAAHLYLT